MSRSLKLKPGRAVLIRLPYVIDSLRPPRYDWHIGRVVAVQEGGVRVAVVDSETFETVRVVELSLCSLRQYCSFGMHITLPP